MKNLFLFFLAFVLFIIIGCQNNPQPNNAVEQAHVMGTSSSTDSTPSVFIVQNDTVKTNKPLFEKKVPINKRCYLPPIITLESEKDTLTKEINAETKNDFLMPSDNIFDKKSQFFTFNANQETTLHGIEGITLTIPADCFEAETGNILRGVGQLEMKEFLKTSDMILANLTTQSDGKMLETGGMIYLNVKDAEGHSVKIRSDKNIKITLPPSVKTADKQLFYGNQQTNGQINWTQAQPIVTKQNTNNYTIIEQNPEFPNGQAALFRFIQNEMVYPKIARENKIEGTVYVSFTVLPEGSLADIQIRRGIGAGCNEEAIRILKKMPRWRPARSQGKRVSLAYTLPIKFSLNASLNASTGQTDSLQTHIPWEAQDTAYANKFVEIMDEQDAIMRSNRLGWINCDRFINFQNTTDFVVSTNKTDVDVRLVFKNYRSIASSVSDSEKKAHFSNVPNGEPVFIVATSPEGYQFNISVTEAVITKDKISKIELKTVEKDIFLQELHRLDVIK